ncbi:putative receptor-like protein kinase [Quercus suber]|uniref:Receptor-like protein kinase n=1 Tax=Quercus suber TaxID=58331 RepID=A0AAW0LRD6_QUESU
MKNLVANFGLLLLSLLLCSVSLLTSADSNTSATCPMDLSYVLRIPWNQSLCQNTETIHDTTAQNVATTQTCCQTLLSLLGIGLAHRLKETSLFNLPDLPTSTSCLNDFQSKITALSLPTALVSSCPELDPLRLVISPNVCAHIETTKDWVNKLGPTTALDSGCKSDLTDLTSCDACVAAGYQVTKELIARDGNTSQAKDCFYFAVLYAAGIVNEYGPESDSVLTCPLGLQLNSEEGGDKGHSGLVFGLTGAGAAVAVMSCLLGMYFWYDRRWRRKKGEGSNLMYGHDLEEQGSKLRVRPNTGSIWYKIEELEKATDNFSQKNFIGQGGFGMVFKGALVDGTVVAVKKVVESDFQGDAEFCNEVEIISNLKHRNLVPLRGCCVVDGYEEYDERGSQRYLVYDYMPNGNLDDHLFPSAGKVEEALEASLSKNDDSVNSNPKSVMERFVMVGILCAHVMVALRPTILDALKMLEGDIEVPAIPDRPTPLGHPSFCGNVNNFSISPTLSGPRLNSGDMLRTSWDLTEKEIHPCNLAIGSVSQVFADGVIWACILLYFILAFTPV